MEFPDVKIRGNEKGALLVASYLILALLGIFSLALYSRHYTAIHSHERSQNLVKAFHLAEAGIDHALRELEKDISYQGDGYTALGRGGYEVLVTAPNPSVPTVRRIDATGHTPSNDSATASYARREITAYVNWGGEIPLRYGAFGCSDIRLSGSATIDSFNSAAAPYSPAAPGTQGDIGTNAVGGGAVSLTGGATVKGNATVGPGGDPAQVIDLTDQAVITGTQGAAAEATPCSGVQAPTGMASQGAIHLSGKEQLVLGGGVYLFDSISITAQAGLTLTGSATIYVQGDVKIAGNGVSTLGNLPKNTVIKVVGSHEVDVSGTKDFYGAVYAPESKVKVSGVPEFFGAVFASSYEQSGTSQLHYDEDLKNIGVESLAGFEILSWQEK